MSGLNSATWAFVAAIAAGGSTCHGQSEAAKETPSSASAAAGGDVNLPGVDTTVLTPREKRDWSQQVSELLAPCSDVPVSIAQCVTEKRSCSRCLPAAKFVLRGVRNGLPADAIEKQFHNRFDADKLKNVPLDGSPTRGPEAAPITMIEFADFTCPHCAKTSPELDKLLEEHPGQIRFAYKFFPLSGPGHQYSELAARAAYAALAQGKFWEMHHALFASFDHLDPTEIDGIARQLGLDLVKLHTEMQSGATTDRITRDKKLGESVDVQGTPTIYINGRSYDGSQTFDEWLALEGVEAPKGGAPAPTPSPSAAPSSGKPAPAPATPPATAPVVKTK